MILKSGYGDQFDDNEEDFMAMFSVYPEITGGFAWYQLICHMKTKNENKEILLRWRMVIWTGVLVVEKVKDVME